MKHYIAASHCAIDGFRIAQVANDPIRIQLLDVLWVAASANQQSEGGSLLGKNLGDVTAHKSGGTCNKGLHKRGLLSNDPLTKFLRLERNVVFSRRFIFPLMAPQVLQTISCSLVAPGISECVALSVWE